MAHDRRQCRCARRGHPFAILLVSSLFAAPTALSAQPPADPEAYLQGLRARLPVSAPWEQWLKTTGELPTLPRLGARAAYLPDPFLFADGRRVRSREEWQERRAEIQRLYEHFITGRWPPAPKRVTAREVSRRREGRVEVAELRLELDGRREPSIGLDLYIPEGRGPFPVFLGPAWTANWARLALRRGYLCAIYAGSDNHDDAAALKDLYPDFALIPRRAWAGARVLDYLETLPAADMSRVVLTGHSRDGKQALYLAAFDERIRAVIPSSSGTFGANPFRFTGERYFSESLERKTRWDPSWFHPRSRFFAGQEHRLPVDQNLLLALVAPRACLLSQALHDDNDPPWGVEQAYLSARQVYEWMGAGERLGVRWRDQLHGYSHATGAMWAYRPELNPILALVEAGYVVLAYDQHGFGTRIREAGRFYERYPGWSRMGLMVEDARSAVDYLASLEVVDPGRISLFGFSLGGTVALFTGALEPRVAGVVSVCGFTPLRGDRVERGGEGAKRYSHLHGLLPRLGFFTGREERIPADFADLLALAAPRPVLVVAPDWDRHAHPEDISAAVSSAAKVYEALGAAGKLELLVPQDVHRLSGPMLEQALKWMRER